MAWSDPRTWVTGETVTAAHMNQEVRDNLNASFPDQEDGNAWSPTLEGTSSDPGTSATAGVEYTIGAIQFVWVRWVLSSGGSGDYFVTLPSTASGLTASTAAGKGSRIGGFHIRDDTPAQMYEGSMLLASTTTAYFQGSSLIGPGFGGRITSTNPRAWASGDVLSMFAQYPIA